LLTAKDALAGVEGVVDLGLYRDATVPQLQIRLNRQALARAGISIDDAGEMVETAMAGRVVTTMWEGEKIVPIRVRLPSSEKADPERIGDLTVPTASGARVPLRELADIEIADGRISIMREANSRYVALKFNVDGRDLGSVVDEAIATVDEHVTVPEGTYLVWGGEFENQQRAMGRLQIIVPVALVLVFMLLYGALGSGRSAATVLLSAPFGLTGGLFGLYFFGIALSVSAAVGFIALLGQVSLAGLLVISAIDDERRAGKTIDAAIAAGASTRFRALLMTALLAMLGLLPMAVSEAVGSETQKPFAVVIVCGMVTTLLVALFVVPVLYRLIAAKRMPNPESLDLDLGSSPDHGAHP
jgi:cobalt-zinc-cadmium resistance protein CzcA